MASKACNACGTLLEHETKRLKVCTRCLPPVWILQIQVCAAGCPIHQRHVEARI